ncbi:DUF6578 domain-containing protein [Leucobacter musarum]|uniref:DUF6578 domain-containing protein n=1 Tax=Leucobacter musarum TaxID=1930747 RepID=UPI0006A75D38|nr:DUF6578 domain-containing protein [Leucobacter musarum]
MRIEVMVSGWEQVCCGDAFAIGDEMRWNLVAADPAHTPAGALPRFTDERHDETPDEVPHWSVAGTVIAIQGITYPDLAVPGEPMTFERDSAHPRVTSLVNVPGSDADTADHHHSEYLVELEVPDSTELPTYVESTSAREWREAQERHRARDLARMLDPVGQILEQAADFAEATFGDVTTIRRGSDRSALSIVPHREGATAVHWVRTTGDSDSIGLHVGDGEWWRDANVENAALAREFVEAAAAGPVSELVVDHGDGRAYFETQVRSADGRECTAREHFTPLGANATGTGVVVMARMDQIERMQRGGVHYLAW